MAHHLPDFPRQKPGLYKINCSHFKRTLQCTLVNSLLTPPPYRRNTKRSVSAGTSKFHPAHPFPTAGLRQRLPAFRKRIFYPEFHVIGTIQYSINLVPFFIHCNFFNCLCYCKCPISLLRLPLPGLPPITVMLSDPFMLLFMSVIYSFSLVSNIPLYIYVPPSHLLMDMGLFPVWSYYE